MCQGHCSYIICGFFQKRNTKERKNKFSIKGDTRKEMPKLTVFELFSGIGAQVKGIKNTGLFDCEVLGTADIEKEAMVSYASIHNGLNFGLDLSEEVSLTDAEMREKLLEKNIGITEKGTNPISSLKGNRLKRYYLAMEKSKNVGDISKLVSLPKVDMLTYSFPCTNFSVAGRQQGSVWTCNDCKYTYNPINISVDKRYVCPNCGGNNIKSTKSGLLYEVERLLVKAREEGKLPNYLLLENVKNLVSKKFIKEFEGWLERLDTLGYNTYYKVLNAKNCGVPQNRERVFAVSILKELDKGKFTFPEPFDLEIKLKDLLEDEVDNKYYVSDEKVQRFIQNNPKLDLTKEVLGTCHKKNDLGCSTRNRVYNSEKLSPTLMSTMYKDPTKVMETNSINNSSKASNTVEVEQLGNIVGTGNWDNPQRGRIYSSVGCSSALNSCSGGGHEPKILCGIDKSNVDAKVREISNCLVANEHTGLGNRQSEGTAVLECIGNLNPSGQGMNGNVFSEGGLAPTLTTNKGEGNKILQELKLEQEKERETETETVSHELTEISKRACLKIRKLTPKECWRLMGFEDSDIEKAQENGVSDSKLYMQAGNSIVTNCIELIMEHLYKAQYDPEFICTDEKILNARKTKIMQGQEQSNDLQVAKRKSLDENFTQTAS